jgi:hypothetical protein
MLCNGELGSTIEIFFERDGPLTETAAIAFPKPYFVCAFVLGDFETPDQKSTVRRSLAKNFVRWFGEETVGPRADYQKIAHEVWRVWSKFQGSEHKE